MTGRIDNLHAMLPVPFQFSDQPDLYIEFVIDTGFTGELTLPPAADEAMQLPFAYDQAVTLANDTDIEVPVHRAAILWHGGERLVHVFATGNRPLLETARLAGCELLVQLVEHGLVTAKEL